jgi:hypothetical protein
MKILSYNCRGVEIPHKKYDLYRLVKLNYPNIIFLQETMGEEAVVILWLEAIFKNLKFLGSYARGRYGGLVIGWNPKKIKLINSWVIEYGLGINFLSEDLGMELSTLNMYGPYQDQIPF